MDVLELLNMRNNTWGHIDRRRTNRMWDRVYPLNHFHEVDTLALNTISDMQQVKEKWDVRDESRLPKASEPVFGKIAKTHTIFELSSDVFLHKNNLPDIQNLSPDLDSA